MSMEFIYRGITEFNELGLIVVFETNPDNPIRDAAAFVWNLKKLSARRSCKSFLRARRCSIRELRSRDRLLMETANAIGAQRIFVDGIGPLTPNSANVLALLPICYRVDKFARVFCGTQFT